MDDLRNSMAFLTALLLLLGTVGCGAVSAPGTEIQTTPTPLATVQPAEPTPFPEPAPAPEPSPETHEGETRAEELTWTEVTDPALGKYGCLVTTLHPYVFAPNGAGSGNPYEVGDTADMMETFGEEYALAAAVNGGIFYDTMVRNIYCFHGKEPDGVLIAGGVVLKSTEPLDHSECTVLVIDEERNVGWTDYYADADAMAAGEWYYYDIYGNTVEGKRIVSALTGFVPILVGGENRYDPTAPLNGYENYVNHYMEKAPRQIFGVRADGCYVVLSSEAEWTLSDAAEAAKAEGCVFAYNLDGGTSIETVLGISTPEDYQVSVVAKEQETKNRIPTFLVFSSREEPPTSALPTGLRAELRSTGVFPAGITTDALAAALIVTEELENADGTVSERQVYSSQAINITVLFHSILGDGAASNSPQIVSESVSPGGTLFYTKNPQETASSLFLNGNTREDGNYYDYSTGFFVRSEDDLMTPGEKTLLVIYTPGGGMEPLTAEIRIRLEE